ncbi:hypothetical protein V1477_014198 [Vespula maculifrons]|uniref:Uncharacterized protein n=1 Tax=Vespula maculifrons TaxID=7453 RepID=A0ABD2BKS4_VESMC
MQYYLIQRRGNSWLDAIFFEIIVNEKNLISLERLLLHGAILKIKDVCNWKAFTTYLVPEYAQVQYNTS